MSHSNDLEAVAHAPIGYFVAIFKSRTWPDRVPLPVEVPSDLLVDPEVGPALNSERRYVRTCMDPDGIQIEEEDYLYTAPSGLPGAGQGLFTAITLYKDEVIAIFHGERLSAKEASDRAAQGQDRYFMELPDGTSLDAMAVEGFAKFANDAKGSASTALRNNAKIALDDGDQVCLRATRRIRTGEEVLCGYGKRYWQRHGE